MPKIIVGWCSMIIVLGSIAMWLINDLMIIWYSFIIKVFIIHLEVVSFQSLSSNSIFLLKLTVNLDLSMSSIIMLIYSLSSHSNFVILQFDSLITVK